MPLSDSMFESPENKWPAHYEANQDYRSDSHAPWVFIIVLALAVAALACVGYLAVKRKNVQIAELFGDRDAVNGLSQRVGIAESGLRDVTSRWDGLTQRVTTLEAQVSRKLEQNRKYAESLTEQLHQQVTAEWQARTSALDARLQQVESDETAQRKQLAQVEDQLQQQISSAEQATSRDLSGVHQELDRNANDLNSLSQRLDRQRVDFEASKGRTAELAPGISLRITDTNKRHQRFRGSLTLAQDGETLWLGDQGANQSVRFYSKESRDPYELVVTDVTTNHSVIGYLLVPVHQQGAPGASSNNAEGAGANASGNNRSSIHSP